MVVGQLLITPTVEICIQQLGRVEEMVNGLITILCDTEYLACAEPLRCAVLLAAEETLVIFGIQCTQLICDITVIVLPARLRNAATLPWETSQMRNDNF